MGLIQTINGGKTSVQLILANGSVISFDASIKEVHKRSSPATKFEIEDGTTISDNIIMKPFDLTIDGMISDTPLSGASALASEALTTAVSIVAPPLGIVAAAAGASLVSAVQGSQTPSQSAYENILSLQESKEPFDVQTSLKTYEDMWINELEVNRDAQTGNVLSIRLSLSQLIIVEPQTTNLTIFSDSNTAAPLADVGRQGVGGPFSQGVTAGLALVGQ